jgi:hypothetical protein
VRLLLGFREVVMRKSNFFAGCAFVLVVGAVLWQDCTGPHPAKEKLYANLARWLDQNVFEDQELVARRLGVHRFATLADEAEVALFAGQLSLADAVARILAASQEHHPDYLRHLIKLEEGATSEERIARNIIRHFEEDERLNENDALRQRLQMQLAELLAKHRQGITPSADGSVTA